MRAIELIMGIKFIWSDHHRFDAVGVDQYGGCTLLTYTYSFTFQLPFGGIHKSHCEVGG